MLLIGDDDLVSRLPVNPLDDDVDGGRELRGEGDLVRFGADEPGKCRPRRLDPEEILVVREQPRRTVLDHGLGYAEQFRPDTDRERRHPTAVQMRPFCEHREIVADPADGHVVASFPASHYQPIA